MKKLKTVLQHNRLYLLLIVFVFVYVIIYVKNYIPPKKYEEENNKFELLIKSYRIDGDKLSIEFKEYLIGNYYFKSEEEKENFNLNINDKVEVNGKLSIPSNNTIFNTFNYKKYLYYKGITHIINIENIKLLKRNTNVFYKIKNYMINRIKKINNEYIFAFILGDTYYIENKIYEGYKINGITHLFSLSALHVSVFSSCLYFILKKIKSNELFSLFIVFSFLLFFSFISSFTPSMLRTLIFFLLNRINKIYKLKIKNTNILYLTLCFLLLINPNYIFNTGFKLSFIITYFILMFNEKNRIKNNIFNTLIISIISFLSSMPIIINMSYEVNIISFFSNIIFIPLVTYIIFPLSLITFVFPFTIDILNYVTLLMENVSIFTSNIFNISIIFPKIKLYEIIIYYFLLFISFRKKSILVIQIVFISYLFSKPYIQTNTFIYFTDVSQGDSTLIVTKYNKSILIDTGGKIKYNKEEWTKKNKEYEFAKSSLIQFYKSVGLKKINYMIITHGDYDHMGEAINLVNNFKVEKVIFNCGEFNDLEKELINVLNKKKIPYYSCIKELNIDDNKLYFLQTKEYDNENDNSNVIYTELNGYKFMLMGDASSTTEKEIIDKYNLPDIDVLKVGHHGSRTSSSIEFINEINPGYSIISVGKNNRYGHPNKEVLDALEESKIYRTDQNGSIMFKINNNKLKIETCSP